MRHALLTAAFVALAGAATGTAADEKYTLKLYEEKKGDRFVHERTKNGKTTVELTIKGVDETKKQNISDTEKEVYTEEIVEKTAGARRATKLSRVYTTAEKTKDGEKTEEAFVGETVLIERKDGKYALTVNGKPLTKKDAPDLVKSFDRKKDDDPRDQDFLPTEPVAVGDSWTIPKDKSEAIYKTFGNEDMKIDAKKSTIGGKLLKAYKKDGAQ
ncbi:MAG: hypothetical protein K2V38_17430, partial [Gemmataceae bacterium]|nr:hypothetical protein [Gemmataceae bacterium]